MPACLYWLLLALEAHNAFLAWVELAMSSDMSLSETYLR